MSTPDIPDGTVIPAVHGDASFPPGVPVPPSPREAPGPASPASERDAAQGPPGVSPARSGDPAAGAHCIGRCDWTAGPGPAADVDRAAEKHTKTTGHPTSTLATLGGRR